MPRVIQRFPDDFFGALTVEANERGVWASYRSLTQRWDQELYEYSNISIKTTRWETSEGGWGNVGWKVLVIGVVAALLAPEQLRRLVLASFVFVALGLFLQQFLKREYLAFYTLGGEHLFTLRMPHGREVAEYVLARTASGGKYSPMERAT